MFFILSKVLLFLLFPAWWVVGLLVWRYFTKKPAVKKRITVVVFAILILFSNNFIYRNLMIAWQPVPVTIAPGTRFDAAILLGGLSGYDKYGHGYFGDNADRFIQTANLYHQGFYKRIIISGGSGELLREPLPEAVFLRSELIKNNIEDSALIMEASSKNTYENGVFSKRIVDSMHLQQPLLLITSAFHMRRSMAVFKKAGLNCISFPCDYKVTPQKFSVADIVPDFRTFTAWPLFLKEIVGLIVYKATGKA